MMKRLVIFLFIISFVACIFASGVTLLHLHKDGPEKTTIITLNICKNLSSSFVKNLDAFDINPVIETAPFLMFIKSVLFKEDNYSEPEIPYPLRPPTCRLV